MDGRLDNKLGTNVDHTWKKGILETIIWDCLFNYHKRLYKRWFELGLFRPPPITFPSSAFPMESADIPFTVIIHYIPPSSEERRAFGISFQGFVWRVRSLCAQVRACISPNIIPQLTNAYRIFSGERQ